jgi:hypothetical protein
MAASRPDDNLARIERLLELLDHLDWHVRVEAVPALAALYSTTLVRFPR